MDERDVVTVFLRNGGDVLLLRRSDEVDTYAGRWGGVAGFAERAAAAATAERADPPAERDPDRAALEAVEEETGIDPGLLEPVRRGDPVTVEDADRDARWVVHPSLFDCPTREVDPNREVADFEWVPPTAILRRETVPDLWAAYDAVRPTVESVRRDREHGSAYVSVRALEVLRDEAALAVEEGGDWNDLAETARSLRDARDGMAALRNRVDRAVHDAAGERTPEAVEAAAEAGIDRALRADVAAAAAAAERIRGERVLTLSRSGTVRAALTAGDPDSVVVAESRPGGEGVPVAEDLADAGLDVAVTADAAVAWLVRDVDAVLVGADAVLPDGSVVNKVGTRGAALAAAREDVPVFAVCAADKVRRDHPDDLRALLERADPADVSGDADVAVDCPLFDVTPPDALAGVVTDDGVLEADGVAAVARELRSLADWTA